MGSGGSGGSGAGGNSSGGSWGGGGWGGTMGSGGNAYSGGGVGGIGTAGTMSGGAGGSAMGGFGNTGAGGSGMAGISSHGGGTPAGFTGQYGDPRGATIGQDAYGNYSSPSAAMGFKNNNQAAAVGAQGLVYKNGVPYKASYVYRKGEPALVLSPYSAPVPKQTNALTVAPGQLAGIPQANIGYGLTYNSRTRPSVDRAGEVSPYGSPNRGTSQFGADPSIGNPGVGSRNYGSTSRTTGGIGYGGRRSL